VQVDQINLSGIAERYLCVQNIRFNKRTHPNEHEMGAGFPRNGCRKGFA